MGMEFMCEFKTITSRIYNINVIGEADLVMSADLSIVCKDGKYGLVHTYKSGDEIRDSYWDEDLVLPCQYDNLFFVETECSVYLIAVVRGKQGVFRLEGCANACYEKVFVKELTRCIYNRVESGRENRVLFLYDDAKISCYSLKQEEVFAECEYFKELHRDWLLCVNGNQSELWDTATRKQVVKLDTEAVSYMGLYERGEVFLLTYWNWENDYVEQQLLFYERCSEKTLFGQKTGALEVFVKKQMMKSYVTEIGKWKPE